MNNCTSLKKEALERGYNPNFSNLCPSQSWSVSKETTDVTITRGMDALDRQSIMTLTLLHEFVYEFRGNNTYITPDRTALLPNANRRYGFMQGPLITEVLWFM